MFAGSHAWHHTLSGKGQIIIVALAWAKNSFVEEQSAGANAKDEMDTPIEFICKN